MSLKQMMENLLQKVNDAHTKVDWSPYAPSAYGLFSSWSGNETFKGVYEFCLVAKHTSTELFQKYSDAFHIIIEMYNQAVKNYRWGVNVEHITGYLTDAQYSKFPRCFSSERAFVIGRWAGME